MPNSMDVPRDLLSLRSLVCKPRSTIHASTTLLSHGKAAANAILQKKKESFFCQSFGLGYAFD